MKFNNKLIILVLVLFVFSVKIVYSISIGQNYIPDTLMINGNTTIEGGRHAYDSFRIQDYLFKTRYPKDEEKMVFLTFDDGPSLDNTPLVLDVLKHYNIKATFFVLASNLDKGEKYEELLRRIVREGHAVASHGYSHNYNYLYPGRIINFENLSNDLNRSFVRMKEILGESFNTRVVRLPGGLNSWKEKDQALQRLNEQGYSVIEWNALSGDSEGFKQKDELFSNAIKTSLSSNFVVMLMHDFAGKSGKSSVESLPQIIEYFIEEGFQFRTMY